MIGLFKNLIMSLLYFFGIVLISLFIYSVLVYFNIISGKISTIIMFLIPIISSFVCSFRLGIRSNKKGYIEGIKLGSIIIIIFLVISLIFSSFNYKSLIYYLIIILSNTLGSMFGISQKKAAG